MIVPYVKLFNDFFESFNSYNYVYTYYSPYSLKKREETETSIILYFSVPGVEEKDVKVLIKGIKLKVKVEKSLFNDSIEYEESFLNLKDLKGTTKEVKNGVLKVTIPKKEEEEIVI